MLKYIDYRVDADGRIKQITAEKIRETEHNVHRLRIYSDLETTGESNYRVNIVFTRADGLTIGPLPMILAQDDVGIWHRFIDIKEKLTEITGQLVFGVSYNLWELNDNNELVLVKKLPIFNTSLYVYDANNKIYDPNHDIYSRLNAVENKVDLSVKSKEIIISNDDPGQKPKDTIWIKIL